MGSVFDPLTQVAIIMTCVGGSKALAMPFYLRSKYGVLVWGSHNAKYCNP